MNPLNQYSFIIIAGLVLLGLGGIFWVTGFTRRKAVMLVALALGFVVAWAGLRTGAGAYQEPTQAEVILREAQLPVLVEFYSDFCATCLATRPTLDALEDELKDELKVVRLDVASLAGQTVRVELHVYATPTFILFDAQGNELWRRSGALDPSEVYAALGKS